MKERKNFVELLDKEVKSEKELTQNGAVAYVTSGENMLDFNFRLSQYRRCNEDIIEKDFSKVFYDDAVLAVKFLFYIGDIREGRGERRIFRVCFRWLANNEPKVALKVMYLIPEYTRWDNLIYLYDIKEVRNEVIELIRSQLMLDIYHMSYGESISLLGKWMPSINASSKERKRLAELLAADLGYTPRNYRKLLSKLRAYLDVTEVKASANKWDAINYSKVPSLANLKYKDAFMKHDTDRRRAYLRDLAEGNTKINASVSQPHEIVSKYGRYGSVDPTLEEMWKALPNMSLKNTLVVRDGSGSMLNIATGSTTCLDVATALAIYCADHNTSEWYGKFITFSNRPQLIDISQCSTLKEKLNVCYSHSDMPASTNMEATMGIILDTAIKNNLTQEEMPEQILVISDMQFNADSGRYYEGMLWNETLFEVISDEFESYGYKIPKIIFWNVNAHYADGATIPMQKNELGLILCSGFSIMNMKMFLSGEIDPYAILLDTINVKRYEVIERLLK